MRVSKPLETPSSACCYRLQRASLTFPWVHPRHFDGKNIAIARSRMATCVAMTTLLGIKEKIMRAIALWLLGVPVGVIILLYLFHII